jgi:hypothetical protein
MPTVYVYIASLHRRQQRRPLPITAPIEQLLRHGLTRWAASPGVLVPQGGFAPIGEALATTGYDLSGSSVRRAATSSASL